ncbi:hypothetical protein ACH4TC_39450 [Streptomyces spororaveus]
MPGPRQAQVVGLQLDCPDGADTDTDTVHSHRRHPKIALRHPVAAFQD